METGESVVIQSRAEPMSNHVTAGIDHDELLHEPLFRPNPSCPHHGAGAVRIATLLHDLSPIRDEWAPGPATKFAN
jgi:hypothetical protein